jgi:ABC-2 type transport system ATP-binding protein
MLEIKNLKKSYGKINALDDVSMTLEPNVYGLLGPNGAGKTTLMNIITLGLDPDAGSILWDGNHIQKINKSYRSVLGYMPQQQGLYEGFSGFDFLCYIATLKAVPRKELKNEVHRVAELVHLKDRLKERLGGYSGGMKQRILLASSIIGDPKLLILDEPTAGLDPKERIRTRSLVKSLASGRIVLVATHVVSDIETIADEVILMKRGKIVKMDRPERLIGEIGSGTLEDVYMSAFADEDEDAL